MTQTLPIDVIIPGVGRVKKQSGVRTKADRDDLIAMLRLLPKQGYVELVRDIKAGRRKLLDVYAHFTAGTLEELRGPRDDAPLEPLLEKWLEEAEVAESTRLQRRDSFAYLKKGMRGKPLLRDLPALLTEFRAQCVVRGHATTFNRAKSAAQAFLRDMIGRHTNAWARVSDVPTLKEARRGRQGLTVAEALGIRGQLAARSPKAARIWWAMCLTGMGAEGALCGRLRRARGPHSDPRREAHGPRARRATHRLPDPPRAHPVGLHVRAPASRAHTVPGAEDL